MYPLSPASKSSNSSSHPFLYTEGAQVPFISVKGVFQCIKNLDNMDFQHLSKYLELN